MIQIIREYPCKIGEIVKNASENGVKRLAIANKGVMFNVPKFYKECINYNILPIIGCEFPLDNGTSVTVFAKSNEGYQNLMNLSSIACGIVGSVEKPLISAKFLNKYSSELTENPDEVCSFGIKLSGPELPKILIPEEYDNAEFYLWSEAFHGFIQLLNNNKISKDKLEEYENRLKYELSVINRLQFSNYFLLVKNYVSWAKENDCGPCIVLGSATGSLVLYCLGISDLDPIENGLVFERFINPNKLSLPDINIEVPVGCREKIYNHLEEMYGKNCVVQVASLAPDGSYIGCNPHEIAVSKSDMAETVPVFVNENGKLTTQYSACELQDYGPAKLRIYENINLSIIKEAEKEFIIPLNDKETFEMFSKGDTDNIEGCSLPEEKKTLKLFQPDSIKDLAIMYALDRPNCWDTEAIILDNKANNKPCEPIIDCLKPILEQTYGCFVFEEQFTDAVCAFTGWSKAEANSFRKSMSQKNRLLSEKYEKDFYADGLANGHSEEECKKLIHDFDFFISNLFLKSYALEMATVIYKVGYIKCHHPELFKKLTKEFEDINTNLLNDCEGEYINCVPDCCVYNKCTQKFGVVTNMKVMGVCVDEKTKKANVTNAPFMLMVINGRLVSEFKGYQSIGQLFKDGWHVTKDIKQNI